MLTTSLPVATNFEFSLKRKPRAEIITHIDEQQTWLFLTHENATQKIRKSKREPKPNKTDNTTKNNNQISAVMND